MIRAILFDKDGTLVDIQAPLGPATCDVLRRLGGTEPVVERLAALAGVAIAARRLLPGCPVISEATEVYGAAWAQALGRPYTAEFGREIDRLYLETTLAHLHHVGDPRAELSELRRHGDRLGVMTNDDNHLAAHGSNRIIRRGHQRFRSVRTVPHRELLRSTKPPPTPRRQNHTNPPHKNSRKGAKGTTKYAKVTKLKVRNPPSRILLLVPLRVLRGSKLQEQIVAPAAHSAS